MVGARIQNKVVIGMSKLLDRYIRKPDLLRWTVITGESIGGIDDGRNEDLISQPFGSLYVGELTAPFQIGRSRR